MVMVFMELAMGMTSRILKDTVTKVIHNTPMFLQTVHQEMQAMVFMTRLASQLEYLSQEGFKLPRVET